MFKSIKETIKNYQPKPLGQQNAYAVLLPLVIINNALHILYEVRSNTISQPGEVAFPGGKIEQGEHPKEAAIRETMEELNIKKEHISILGEIDYFVQNHRTVHCFVGKLAIENIQELTPNEQEVASLFTIPLDSLLREPPTYYDMICEMIPGDQFPLEKLYQDGKHYQRRQKVNHVPFYHQSPHTLWGMTALFTNRFTEIIKKTDTKD